MKEDENNNKKHQMHAIVNRNAANKKKTNKRKSKIDKENEYLADVFFFQPGQPVFNLNCEICIYIFIYYS